MLKKKLLIALGLGITSLGLAACSSADIQPNPAPLTHDQEIALKKKLKKYPFPKPFFQVENHKEQVNAGKKVKLYTIAQQLKTNYADVFKVSYQTDHNWLYDHNNFQLIPTAKNFNQVLKLCFQKNSQAIENWNEFANNVTKTSQSVSHVSGDTNVTLTVMNPKKTTQKLFQVKNGHVLYNRFPNPKR